MYVVTTFLGGLSELEMTFHDKKSAVNYKNQLIDLFDFDADYISIYFEEV